VNCTYRCQAKFLTSRHVRMHRVIFELRVPLCWYNQINFCGCLPDNTQSWSLSRNLRTYVTYCGPPWLMNSEMRLIPRKLWAPLFYLDEHIERQVIHHATIYRTNIAISEQCCCVWSEPMPRETKHTVSRALMQGAFLQEEACFLCEKLDMYKGMETDISVSDLYFYRVHISSAVAAQLWASPKMLTGFH